MEDRELENICKSSIYSRIEKDARFNFPGGNLPVEEGIRRVSTRQFAVLIEADAALMKRSNRVFRLKNGPLEMKSSVAEGCFLRSRHSINSLFLFFLNELRCLKDRGCRSSIMLVFLIHFSILLPFFFDSFRYLKFPSSMDHIQVYVLAIRCIHFYWNKRQSGLSDRNNNGMVFKINRRGQKNLIKSSREREREILFFPVRYRLDDSIPSCIDSSFAFPRIHSHALICICMRHVRANGHVESIPDKAFHNPRKERIVHFSGCQ